MMTVLEIKQGMENLKGGTKKMKGPIEITYILKSEKIGVSHVVIDDEDGNIHGHEERIELVAVVVYE